jgi:hypothetical protein
LFEFQIKTCMARFLSVSSGESCARTWTVWLTIEQKEETKMIEIYGRKIVWGPHNFEISYPSSAMCTWYISKSYETRLSE